jgi:hypothetical protein
MSFPTVEKLAVIHHTARISQMRLGALIRLVRIADDSPQQEYDQSSVIDMMVELFADLAALDNYDCETSEEWARRRVEARDEAIARSAEWAKPAPTVANTVANKVVRKKKPTTKR